MKDSTKHAFKWVFFGLPHQLEPLTRRERDLGVSLSILAIVYIIIVYVASFFFSNDNYLNFAMPFFVGSHIGMIIRLKYLGRRNKEQKTSSSQSLNE